MNTAVHTDPRKIMIDRLLDQAKFAEATAAKQIAEQDEQVRASSKFGSSLNEVSAALNDRCMTLVERKEAPDLLAAQTIVFRREPELAQAYDAFNKVRIFHDRTEPAQPAAKPEAVKPKYGESVAEVSSKVFERSKELVDSGIAADLFAAQKIVFRRDPQLAKEYSEIGRHQL